MPDRFAPIVLTGMLVAIASAGAQPATNARPVTVRCASRGERVECPAETSGGVVLVRGAGSTSCIEGKTWGYDTRAIWVTDGCSGEFELGPTASKPQASAPESQP